MLTLELGAGTFLVRGKFLLHAFAISIMDAINPFLRLIPDLVLLVTQHRLPSGREIGFALLQIPIPEPVICAARGKRVTFLALS